MLLCMHLDAHNLMSVFPVIGTRYERGEAICANSVCERRHDVSYLRIYIVHCMYIVLYIVSSAESYRIFVSVLD